MEMNGIKTDRLTEIKNVSGTAFVVAEFRAEENDETYPLYRDSVVGLFLNEDTRQAAGSVAASFPLVRALVKIRTKYFDDMLEEHILSGFRQVVILGAGLDTRAVRKQATDVTYFEIDDAATLELKQTCYEEQGVRANVKFIPGNYVTDGMIDLLRENDFDFDLPTYLIWEGNTMYLPLESTKHTMTQLRKHLKQFRLSFDYMADAVITKTTGDPGITDLVESFANMGAPWLSGIRDIQALAHEMNLRVIENFKTAELRQTYWPGRPLTSPIFKFYSVCTLGSVSAG
jgi:methyltransferase (TIGR00027 family)